MKAIKLGTAGMLFFAIFQLPYGYYTLLRLVVSISSGISAFGAMEKDQLGLALAFGFILLLFNPISFILSITTFDDPSKIGTS